MSQSDNRAYGLTFTNSIPDLPTFIKQYFEKGFLYGRTFSFLPLQKLTLKNIRDGTHFFTRDWKTNLSTHTGILSQLALIYRCIVLRSPDKIIKESNLQMFGKIRIPELDCDVKNFLTTTNIGNLDGINAGELSRKILSFLKSRLFSDSMDLKALVDSKFFYEVYYVPKRQVHEPFTEEIIISFLGIRFKAYLFEESFRKIVILEMNTTNKVFWFYCFSLAQRAFGLISQTVLDERLLETRDFILPLIPPHYTYLLKTISVSKLEPTFYKKMNKVFRQTSNYQDADMPIVTQDIKFNKHFTNKVEKLNVSNIHTSDFAVFLGNVKLFKLPFGNLVYQNYLDLECDALKEIKIDGLSLHFLLENNDLIEKYLKTKLETYIETDKIMSVLPEVVNNLLKEDNIGTKFRDCKHVFELDLTNYNPTVPYEMPEKKTTPQIVLIPQRMKELEASEGILQNLLTKKHDFLKKEPITKDLNVKRDMFSIDLGLGATAVDEMKNKTVSNKPTQKMGKKSLTKSNIDISLEETDDVKLDWLFDASEGFQQSNEGNILIDNPKPEEKISNENKDSKTTIDVGSIGKQFDKPFFSFGPKKVDLSIEIPSQEATISIRPMNTPERQEVLHENITIEDSELECKDEIVHTDDINIGIQLSEEELRAKMGMLFSFGKKSQTSEKKSFLQENILKENTTTSIGKQLSDESLQSSISNLFKKQETNNSIIDISPSIENKPEVKNILQSKSIDIGLQMKEKELTSKITDLLNKKKSNEELSIHNSSIEQAKEVKLPTQPKVDIGKQLSEADLQSKMSLLFSKNKKSKEVTPPVTSIEITPSVVVGKDQLDKHLNKNVLIGNQLPENLLLNLIKPKLQKFFDTDTQTGEEIVLNADNTLDDMSNILKFNQNIDLSFETTQQDTNEAQEARDAFDKYMTVVESRHTNLGVNIQTADLDSIDLNRNLFATLDDLEESEVGELFEEPIETTEYHYESSSSNSSEEDEGVSWYQLVPSRHLIEGTYNFDERCKKSMMNLNDFLFTMFVDKDMQEIVNSRTDLGLIIVLCNRILQQRLSLKITKKQKALIKSLILSLKRTLKKNNNVYFSFADNMGIKYESNKLKFYAMLPLEDKQMALDRASSNPMVKYAQNVANCSVNVSWLVMPLYQEDLDIFCEKGFKAESLHRSTQFSNLVNDFFPRIKQTQFTLKGKYGF